jgi:hypothetical protein
MRRGVRGKYLLVEAPTVSLKGWKSVVRESERPRKALAVGDAKAIIKATCDAPCGVFLVDLEEVTRVR